MTPGLWGGLTALGWGTADLIARFSGRAIGHRSALFGMLLVGSVVLSLWVWLAEPPLRWTPPGLWLLDAGGYMALYEGSYGEGSEIAAVPASTFGAVTALLARLVLREPMRGVQWIGIAIIVGGVAVLSA